MTPLQSRLTRYIGFTSIAIAVVGVLFSVYAALETGGYSPLLIDSNPVMWGLTFFWLTNTITLVLNALVWVCGRRPRWLAKTLGIQLLLSIGLLFVEG
ncbi:hypothetical protein ACIQUF_04505 [Pseudomonas sp. NPDC090233]|uniref:hypothetical protein n=1 Tax=Pseudomonas sp. NPDC090233 TaxID=3364479 RepID=UPI00383AAB5D